MRNRLVARRILHAIVALTAIAATVLFMGSAAAPTTQGLILQASSHPGTAAAGNGHEAFILASAYNEAGPIRGILGGSFSVVVVASPSGAAPIKKVSVTEPVSGIYKIAIVPELSSHRWSSGKYVFSITLTSPNGTGVVVGDLIIDY